MHKSVIKGRYGSRPLSILKRRSKPLGAATTPGIKNGGYCVTLSLYLIYASFFLRLDINKPYVSDGTNSRTQKGTAILC